MGLGVLEDKKWKDVPGTSVLGEKAEPAVTDVEGVKHLKKHGDIVLIPQPSDSPNDPLNWAPWWKNTIIGVLAFASGVTIALGPMLTPGLEVLAMKFKVNPGLVSGILLGSGAWVTGGTTFFTAAGATVFGKRPLFFYAQVILVLTSFWGLFASTFTSLAAMRIIQGIASAPLETLVTSTVSDLFFVHQRGSRLSIWNLFISSGVTLGQVISGQIITRLGIEWTFGISGFILIPVLIGMYLAVPETAYTKRMDPMHPANRMEYEPGEKEETLSVTELAPRKKTYLQTLAIHNGRISDESFWKMVLKPLKLVFYPAVVFSTVVFGSFFTWLLAISLLSVTIFSKPPYNLNSAQIGLTQLPLLPAGLIFTPISGWVVDKFATFMAKKNNGIFEPEFRLPPMVIAVIFSSIGFIGYGISTQAGAPIYYPIAFMTIHSISIPFATQVSFAYTLDCHPQDANQAFVTINFMKALITFIASNFINAWLDQVGPRKLFIEIFYLNFGICCLTIPMYIYGKKLRAKVARKWPQKEIQ